MPYRVVKRGTKYHIQKRSGTKWGTVGKSTTKTKARISIGHRKRGANE